MKEFAMKEFIINPSQTTEEQMALAKLLENREWFDKNIHELQKEYRGKIVVVHQCCVVASADNVTQAKEAVKGKIPLDEALIIIVPAEDIVVVPYPG